MSTTETNTPTGDAEMPRDPNAVTINIDGVSIEARKGEMVIAAADRSDSFIPRFCYHPRMEPVGMCRQCLVEVEGPRGPMMVVSCMTPVADGQIVRTDTPQVKRAQEGILELLLANHPLDCPVCDKGGECPLQDQAFSHGPGESRYIEEKRHYEKPIAISDLVYLDRERCILCDRCTRFADEVAGDPLIHFTQRGNNTQVMTFPGEPFASYFSGNTVQICPVGALTAQPYRFKARPWDLEQQESTCTTCSVGCRIVAQSSRDELVRYQGVDIDPVNWGWMCDRGRFNFQAINSEERLTTPLVSNNGRLSPSTWTDALNVVTEKLRSADGSSIAIIGGARGTNEDAWAWAQLADKLGVSMRDAQLDDGLPASIYSYPQATIDAACAAPTIILLSPDLKEELPVLYLRVRNSVQKNISRVIEISQGATGLTKYAWKSFHHEPGQQFSTVTRALADPDVRTQLAKGPVVVIAGRANLAESADHTMAAIDHVIANTANASVLAVNRRGNVRGALALGLAPRDGKDTAAILEAAAAGRVEVLMLVGADPLSDVADAELARRGINGAKFVVSLDTVLSPSAELADVVLPAAAFGEKTGTTTNLEGRVTNVVQQVTPAGTSRPDWMVAAEIAALLGRDLGLTSVKDITARIAESVPGFDGVSVSVAVRRNGIVVSSPALAPLAPSSSSSAERNAHDFRVVLSRKMYDKAIGTAMSPSLKALAPGASVLLHPLDLERVGVAEGSMVKLINGPHSVSLPVFASPAVVRGTAAVPFNQPGADIRDVVRRDSGVVDVRIERIS